MLAAGALVCPACTLPISPAPRLRPRERLTCAYCEHTAIALDFLREGAIDVPANDVVLVARIAV